MMLQIRENIPLAPYTTLGIGGAAKYMAEITSEDMLLEALELAYSRSWGVFILGGGSNLLVADEGFPGLVLHIGLRGIDVSDEDSGDIVSVAAGEDWDAFVEKCVGRSLAGVECMSGIPGTVGATPVQNVGAYGQEVSDVILSVRVMDREMLSIRELSNADCGFSYRHSIFNTSQQGRYIVLRITCSLFPRGRPRLQYPDLQRFFAGRRTPPSLAEVRDAVLQIRAGKGMVITTEDRERRNAGSFFRNPLVDEETAGRIEEAARPWMTERESLPRHAASGGLVKLSAAWLIEHAGFHKGYVRGPVGISSRHALSLVNLGGACAGDILVLMREIQEGVNERFGITLEPEPEFVGF